MRTFSLVSFAAFVGTLRAEMDAANYTALDHAARIVQTEAKRVLGTHDYNWAPLAPSTLARKAADTPGLETTEMRESVHRTVDHKEAQIGSDNDKAVWFEIGTIKQPPRSFLAGALQHKKDEVVDIIGRVIYGELIGESVAGPNSMLPKP